MEKRETVEKDGILYIKCNKCWEFKEATNEFFDKNHTWFMWLQWSCKICTRKAQHEYCIRNKNKLKENRKRFYERHKEYVSKTNKEWRENNKEHFLQKCRDYRENNKEFYKEYMESYRGEHKDELREKRVKRDLEKGYIEIHNITANKIRKLWIRPLICPICGKRKRIYTHHPNYERWYEVVFCCQSCHLKIHSWAIECPTPINLLDYNKQ